MTAGISRMVAAGRDARRRVFARPLRRRDARARSSRTHRRAAAPARLRRAHGGRDRTRTATRSAIRFGPILERGAQHNAADHSRERASACATALDSMRLTLAPMLDADQRDRLAREIERMPDPFRPGGRGRGGPPGGGFGRGGPPFGDGGHRRRLRRRARPRGPPARSADSASESGDVATPGSRRALPQSSRPHRVRPRPPLRFWSCPSFASRSHRPRSPRSRSRSARRSFLPRRGSERSSGASSSATKLAGAHQGGDTPSTSSCRRRRRSR